LKLHTLFLRQHCILPDQIDLNKEPFCKGWETVIGFLASELDAGIRKAGWHFMWMTDSQSSIGLGATAETANRHAVINALKRVNGRFDAAELESFQVTNFLGMRIAKVTLLSRQIQKHASLDSAVTNRLHEFLAL
jgi:hypothetical protein